MGLVGSLSHTIQYEKFCLTRHCAVGSCKKNGGLVAFHLPLAATVGISLHVASCRYCTVHCLELLDGVTLINKYAKSLRNVRVMYKFYVGIFMYKFMYKFL